MEKCRGNDAGEQDGGGAGQGEEQGGRQMEDGFLQGELQDRPERKHEVADPAFGAEMPCLADDDIRRAEDENRGIEEAEEDIAVVLHETFFGAWNMVVPAEFHADRAAAEQRQHDQKRQAEKPCRRPQFATVRFLLSAGSGDNRGEERNQREKIEDRKWFIVSEIRENDGGHELQCGGAPDKRQRPHVQRDFQHDLPKILRDAGDNRQHDHLPCERLPFAKEGCTDSEEDHAEKRENGRALQRVDFA